MSFMYIVEFGIRILITHYAHDTYIVYSGVKSANLNHMFEWHLL